MPCRHLGSAIAAGLLMLAMCTVARAQNAMVTDERQTDFRIEAQPLAAALDAYSLATGIQLFYASALTQGLVSAPVSGRYTPQEAILVLLGGTGLRPRLTASNAITLDRIAARGSVTSGETADAAHMATQEGAAVLRLGTLRVEAKPERLLSRRYRFYAGAVRAEVARALRRNKLLRESPYRTRLSIWFGPNGRIAQTNIHTSSGNAAIDAAIVTTLHGVVVRPDPPEGMPQPVHIDVSADAP